MSTSKSLVLAFIWILLLSFIFILFVYILGESRNRINLSEGIDDIIIPGIYFLNGTNGGAQEKDDAIMLVYWAQDSARTETRIVYQERIAKGDYAGKMIRHKYGSRDWTSWQVVAVDIPTFYKNYNTVNALAQATGNISAKPKAYYINQDGGSVIVDSDFQYSNRDSRVLIVGYDMKARRCGLVLVNSDKTLNWLLKPNGWDGYFRIDVGDTNISVTRVGSQNCFFLGILNWWEV